MAVLRGLKQMTWWEGLKGPSLPLVTPPDKLTASLGDANETYPAKGGNPKGYRVSKAQKSITWSKGKTAFLPKVERKCVTPAKKSSS